MKSSSSTHINVSFVIGLEYSNEICTFCLLGIKRKIKALAHNQVFERLSFMSNLFQVDKSSKIREKNNKKFVRNVLTSDLTKKAK